MDKWIAVVGKPGWRPKKTSRICSLHFSESDILHGMGYQRFNLRKDAVPKDCSSIVVEKEPIDIAMLKSKETCNATNISKSASSSEICVSDKSAAWNHNCLKNDINDITIENGGSSTFGTQDPNQLIQKAIYHPGKEHKLIQTDSKEIDEANISKSVSSNETSASDEGTAWDHNYSKNNVTIIIKNDDSSTPGTRDSNQSVQKTILYPDQKLKLIQIELKDVPILNSSTNFNHKIRKEIDFVNATKKIKELSKGVKDMKTKNRTLQQKLRRYNEKVILIKELFDRLQQEKLISGDSLQLIRKQLERLTSRTFQNNVKNEGQLERKEIEKK